MNRDGISAQQVENQAKLGYFYKLCLNDDISFTIKNDSSDR